MIRSIDEYVAALRQALAGADRALVQDAVADAQEYLTNALAAGADEGTGNDAERLQAAIASFGMPEEIALAYREIEQRAPVDVPAAVPTRRQRKGFLAVYSDRRAWTSLLYMSLTILSGYAYLMWMIVAGAFSVAFSIFIIGIPLALAFLLSLRAIALLEGRFVEALLDIRMPRRPVFFPRRTRWLDQLRALVNDRHTWFTVLYASTLWIASVAYLFVIVVGVTLSFTLIATPVIQEWLDVPVLTFGSDPINIPRWLYPVPVVAGFLLWTSFLHLCRAVGRLHGRLAKALLVGEGLN